MRQERRALVEEGCGDPRRYWPIDARFHRVIARASGHHRLVELLEHLSLPIELTPTSFTSRDDPAFVLRQHFELLEALKSEDRDVALASVGRNAREQEDDFRRKLIV